MVSCFGLRLSAVSYLLWFFRLVAQQNRFLKFFSNRILRDYVPTLSSLIPHNCSRKFVYYFIMSRVLSFLDHGSLFLWRQMASCNWVTFVLELISNILWKCMKWASIGFIKFPVTLLVRYYNGFGHHVERRICSDGPSPSSLHCELFYSRYKEIHAEWCELQCLDSGFILFSLVHTYFNR